MKTIKLSGVFTEPKELDSTIYISELPISVQNMILNTARKHLEGYDMGKKDIELRLLSVMAERIDNVLTEKGTLVG